MGKEADGYRAYSFHVVTLNVMLRTIRGLAAVLAIGLGVLSGTLSAIAGIASVGIASADEAVVDTDGQNLNLRAAPSMTSTILDRLPHGLTVELLDGSVESEGYVWRQVRARGLVGWVAASYLLSVAPTRVTATALPTPPVGGITMGLTRSTSLEAIMAAQPLEVASLTLFDIDAQRFRVHVMGEPPIVNTLTDGTFGPADVVMIRRAGTFVRGQSGISTTLSTSSIATALPVTPRGGLTVGLAGSHHLTDVITAQPFAVESIYAWDVASQGWFTYIKGAPALLNSLTDDNLSANSPVFMRRSATLPDLPPVEVPDSASAEPRVDRISNYYCEQGEIATGIGDGGGWCGAMRNGEIVHAGAAACAPDKLGMRFWILGDPTERMYTRADTGGAVGSGHRDIWFADSDEGYLWWQQVGPLAEVMQFPQSVP